MVFNNHYTFYYSIGLKIHTFDMQPLVYMYGQTSCPFMFISPYF